MSLPPTSSEPNPKTGGGVNVPILPNCNPMTYGGQGLMMHQPGSVQHHLQQQRYYGMNVPHVQGVQCFPEWGGMTPQGQFQLNQITNCLKRSRENEGGSEFFMMTPMMPQAHTGEKAAMNQRRKQSHNATEQKRRQRINERMSELKDVLPMSADSGGDKQPPIDKASILSDACEHIRRLQAELATVMQRKNDLEIENQELQEENEALARQTGLRIKVRFPAAEAPGRPASATVAILEATQ